MPDKWRRAVERYALKALLTAFFIIATLATGCGGGEAALSGKVVGTPDTSVVKGDTQARKNVYVGAVWCAWQGSHVQIGGDVVNGMDAHVTVHLWPTYSLERAGEHGHASFNDQSIGVDAGETRAWVVDAGEPEGVDGSPRISGCQPEVFEIDVG